jgi:hypothetical protein
MSQNTVTVDSSNGGSLSSGNAFVNGHFGATFVYVSNTLSGGNVSASGVLTMLANVAVTNGTSNVVTITSDAVSTVAITPTGNVTISGNTTILNSANVIFSGANITFSNSPINGNLNIANTVTVSSNVVFNSSVIIAGGGFGTAGQVLYSNGTSMFWNTLPANNGVISNSSGLFARANNGIIANADGIFVHANSGIIANTSGVFVQANTGIIANTNGVFLDPAYYVTLTANNTDSQTFYIPLTNSTSGVWSNGVISTTKLYFTPSTGDLNATNFNSLSDMRFKKNISEISDASSIIAALKAVEFEWTETDRLSAGLIAQDVEKILPHLIFVNEKGVKSLNYIGIIAYLIKSNQEMCNRIHQLESKTAE